MNYKKTLEEIERELENEPSKMLKNRLIVIKNSLKQIIKDIEEDSIERSTFNDVENILDKITLTDIFKQNYIIEKIDMFPGTVFVSLVNEDTEILNSDIQFSEDTLNLFKSQLIEEIPSIRVENSEKNLSCNLILYFDVEYN